MTDQYLMIAAYLVALALLGYLSSRKLNKPDDFFNGGRRLTFWVTALSTQATGESAWLLLGLTGLGAMVGVSAFWVVLGELIGVGIAWFLMAAPFQRAAEHCNAVTTTDYLIHRFSEKSGVIRKLTVIALSFFCTIYAAAEIDATGALMAHSLGWNYYLGAIAGFLVVTWYSSAGGFLAVAWTDSVQGIMMMLALLVLPVVAYYSLSSPVGIMDTLSGIDPDLLTLLGPGDALVNGFEIIGLMAIGLGFMGTPHIFSRFLAVKSHKEIARGRWVAILYTLVTDTAAVTIGILGRCIYTTMNQEPQEVLGDGGQNVMPMLTADFLPSMLSGFYTAAILAAIMSTFSSLLLLAVSSVTYDGVCHGSMSGRGVVETKRLSRMITWGLALIALLVAIAVTHLLPSHTIFWFAVFGMSGITATFSPMMIMALFWRNYSSAGAVASMVSGFVMVLMGKLWLQHLDGVGVYFQAMETLPLAFVVSMLSGWVFSLVYPDRCNEQQDMIHNLQKS